MKTWTELVAALLALYKAIRLALFKSKVDAALKQTEETDGDTSKEEDILRRGG